MDSIHKFLSTLSRNMTKKSSTQGWFANIKAEEVLWCLALGLGIMNSFIFIQSNLQEWSGHPVQTTIETTAHPIQNIPFPSVTICEGQDMAPRKFGFVEKFMNRLLYECRKGERTPDERCQIYEPFRETFKTFLGILEKNMKEKVEILANDPEYMIQFNEYYNFIEYSYLPLIGAVNVTEMDDLWEKYMKLVDGCRLGECSYTSMVFSGLRTAMSTLSKQYGIKRGETTIESCLNETRCRDDLVKWRSLYFKTTRLLQYGFSRIGSTLKQFQKEMFESSLRPNSFATKFATFSDLDTEIGTYFIQLMNNLLKLENPDAPELQLSVYDLPGLFSVVTPRGTRNGMIFGVIFPPNTEIAYTTHIAKECGRYALNDYGRSWNVFLGEVHNKSAHPCYPEPKTPCCTAYTGILQDHMETVLKVMKFAHLQGKVDEHMDRLEQLFGEKLEFLGLLSSTLSRFNGEPLHMLTHLPMVPECTFQGEINIDKDQFTWHKYNRENEKRCNMFEPVLTDVGICHAFNGIPFSKAFKDSQYIKTFQNVHVTESEDKIIHMATGSGSKFGLQLVLDGQTVTSSMRGQVPRSKFQLGINNLLEFFNVNASGLVVHAGFETTIKVMPSELVSVESLESLTPRERGCRFTHENENMKVLSQYTRAGCQMECMMERAKDLCKCVPYNFPRLDTDEHPLCDMFGNYCFRWMMGNFSNLDGCGCDSDCNYITYHYFESQVPLNVKEMCSQLRTMVLSPERLDTFTDRTYIDFVTLVKSKYKALNQNEGALFWQRYKTLMGEWNGTDDKEPIMTFDHFCEHMFTKDIALVNIQLGTLAITKSVQNLKITPEEKLAIIGGTVGIFTGLSFLSFFELIKWIFRGFGRLQRYLRPTPRSRKKVVLQ